MSYINNAIWLIFFIIIVVNDVFTARILVVVPFPGRSHHTFTTAIMKTLAARGHEIVEYSPYPPQKLIPNHTHFEIHTSFEEEQGGWTYDQFIKILPGHRRTIGFRIEGIWKMNYKICAETFQNNKIKRLLKSNEHFDLVMTESSFGEESLLAFGHRFSAPTITIEGFFPWSILNSDAGNILSISSVPDFTSTTFVNEFLSFKDRLLNLISISLSLFFYNYSHIPTHNEIIKKNFDCQFTPSVSDMVSNVSLYLTNSHFTTVNYIHPYTPNIIPIGGIHIPYHSSQLLKDHRKFMDEANEGVIYLSFGTVVPIHVMPKDILQLFINVFKKLPQKVLWRINLDSLPNLPKNVRLVKWVPQLDILSHPNCVLFITHGGLFSHQEAIYSGVPTIGIPFFSDQPFNTQFSEHRGVGVKLDFTSLSEQSLLHAINMVLSNLRYKENAMRLSRTYRDQPQTPADRLVFWVEYVIRHRGAEHLRPQSAHMPLYQLTLVDVMLTVISICCVLLWLTIKTVLVILPLKKEKTKFSCKKLK